MIWFNDWNKLFYTVEKDVVLCRREGEGWRHSAYEADHFQEIVSHPRFLPVPVSLENK